MAIKVIFSFMKKILINLHITHYRESIINRFKILYVIHIITDQLKTF